MGGRVAFWFEFASTYSYLSTMRIEQMAARAGVAIDWHPFLLGPIFHAQGWKTSPFNLYPAKGRYMWRDMERICARRGLAFHKPDPFPQNGVGAARLVLAAQAGAQSPDQVGALVRAIYGAQFGNRQDISSPETLSQCLIAVGLPVALLDLARSDEIKARLRQQGDRASALDIFGAPSFVVNGDLFWGDDRLEQALAAAATV
ncbi:2-hydroxychromene-2-carboxylate isomerase [Aliisedimentitalea scapharcae]|uniref:2-hydroxychromene-2-carboxylate isomerase n=1 Tax=Aliisedimentitalea scapharcae TaxID=1524259 RepID=A0ABZ2XYU1_9RHOB